MKINIYLSFNNQAEEAFAFYASLFGREVKDTFRVSDSPMATHFPAEQQDKIMWTVMELPNLSLYGEDAGLFNPIGDKLQGQPNAWVSIAPDNRDEADRLFSELSQGGQVLVPLSEQFFGYYGRCIDQFGIGWEVLLSAKKKPKVAYS